MTCPSATPTPRMRHRLVMDQIKMTVGGATGLRQRKVGPIRDRAQVRIVQPGTVDHRGAETLGGRPQGRRWLVDNSRLDFHVHTHGSGCPSSTPSAPSAIHHAPDRRRSDQPCHRGTRRIRRPRRTRPQQTPSRADLAGSATLPPAVRPRDRHRLTVGDPRRVVVAACSWRTPGRSTALPGHVSVLSSAEWKLVARHLSSAAGEWRPCTGESMSAFLTDGGSRAVHGVALQL